MKEESRSQECIRYQLRDASRSLQWIFRFNSLTLNVIGVKIAVFNGKSLRFLSFSVLLAANMRFSRILLFRSNRVFLGVYIDNLYGRQFIYICYFLIIHNCIL